VFVFHLLQKTTHFLTVQFRHMTPKRYHPISSTSRPIPQLSILTSPQHSQRSAICESQAPSPTIYPLHAPSLGSNYPESAKSAPVPTIELLLKPNDEMPVRFGDGRAYLINASEEQKDLACHYSGNGYISPAASPATGTDSLPESLSLTFPGKDNTERGLNELSTLFFSHLSLQGYSLLGEYKGVSAMIRRLRLQYCDGVLSPTMTKAVNSALQLHRFGYGVSNPNTDSLRESEFRAVHTILTFMGEAPQEYFHEEEILAIDELKKKHLTLCTSCQSGSHSSNTTPLGNVSIDQVMRRE
jgi:hypothetical protein